MVRSLQASRSSLDKMSPAGSYATLDKPQHGYHQGSRQRGLSHSPYGWKHHHHHNHQHHHHNKLISSTPPSSSSSGPGGACQEGSSLSSLDNNSRSRSRRHRCHDNGDEEEDDDTNNQPVPMIESPITPQVDLSQSQSLPPLYLEDGFQGIIIQDLEFIDRFYPVCLLGI